MNGREPDAILLVHGTFAGDEADEGPAWWQRARRNFWGYLGERLGGLAAPDRVFHWSGENKERHRRAAGAKLLKLFRSYETAGRPYHVVGHSHGGSVIWTTLRRAAASVSKGDTPLPHLRSWTTVGTPFYTYRPRWSEAVFLLPMLLAMPVLLGVFGQAVVARGLVGQVWGDATVGGSGRWTLVVLVLIWALALLVALVAAYRLGALLVGVWRSGREAAADRRAASAFRDRGRCLWSREDEAINGLRASLALHDLRRRETGTSTSPRVEGEPQPPEAAAATSADGSDKSAVIGDERRPDPTVRAEKPVRILPRKGPLSALYGPIIDQFFFEVLKQFVQGNDLVGRRLAAVTAEPPGFAVQPALPEPVQTGLEDRVADGLIRAPEAIQRLRRVLGEVAFGGQIQSPFEPQPGQQPPVHATLLIHTLYFPSDGDGEPIPIDLKTDRAEIPSVATLIVDRIRGRIGADLPGVDRPVEADPARSSGAAIVAAGAQSPARVPGSTRKARLKAATVPLTLTLGLSSLLLVPALVGPRLFERLLPYTTEGQIRRLLAEIEPILRDGAGDAETLPAVRDYALALADASARGPLRPPGAGPVESRAIPAVKVPADAAADAIGLVDEPRLRGDLDARIALGLATADPPRSALARAYADRAVAEAHRSRATDPGTAVEVLVQAADARRRIGDRQAAFELMETASSWTSEVIKARFLELQGLARVVQDAPKSASQFDPNRGEVPGYIPRPQAVSVPDQDLANRLATAIFDAAEIARSMAEPERARSLIESLIRDYRRVEDMGLQKGFASYYWSFGLDEELRLAAILRDLGIEVEHPEFRDQLAEALPGLAQTILPERVWRTIGGQVESIKALDLAPIVVEAAERSIEAIPPDAAASLAAACLGLDRPDLARLAAAGALRDLDRYRPNSEDLRQLNYPNVFYQNYYKRFVDRYPLYRIIVRLDLARLGLEAGDDLPAPADLFAFSWTEALAMRSRVSEPLPSRGSPAMASAQGPGFSIPSKPSRDLEVRATAAPGASVEALLSEEGFDRIGRATALAAVVLQAAGLEGDSAPAIQKMIAERFESLAADPDAGLVEEAQRSDPLGMALRHLVAAFVARSDLETAGRIADLIPHASQRVASRLILAEHKARGGAADRAEAVRLMEAIEVEIRETLPRRLDRSPRLAEAAAVWALLGQTTRGIQIRRDCRTLD